MMDMFDSLGTTLNDMIGSHTNNSVGWAGKQVFGYADGGEVSDSSSPFTNGSDFIQAVTQAAKPVLNSGRQDSSVLGGNFYNSPAYLAQHFSQMGKFFTGGEPGNLYTNRYKTPDQSKPPQGQNPSDFYAQWYMTMRRFAEAEEVADRGQPPVKSR